MKLKPAVLIFFLMTSIAFSRSINITTPKGWETWKVNQGYYILWKKSGIMNSVVKIRLFSSDGSTKIYDITNKTPNNGSFFWKIPGSLSSKKYILRVKTLDNKVSDDSLPFRIQGLDKKELSLWTPVSGTFFVHGDKIKIEWNGINLTGNLNIVLERSDGSAKIAVKTNYSAGKSPVDYIIPAAVLPGTYKIKIVWGAITIDSGVFTIKSSKQNRTMDIISPKKDQVFKSGDILPVEWISSGITGYKLTVFLARGTNGVHYVAMISDKWPNAPHLKTSWKIPLNMKIGNYKIVVQEGTSTYYHGKIFRISLPNSITATNLIRNNTPLIVINPDVRVGSGKNPHIISFKPDKLARKKIHGLKSSKDLYMAKLSFSWKDEDGDVANGKWHFSYKGLKSGSAGSKTGQLKSAVFNGNFNSISGIISGFAIMDLTGIDNENVEIAFVLEDEKGNFSNKATGYVTLSPY